MSRLRFVVGWGLLFVLGATTAALADVGGWSEKQLGSILAHRIDRVEQGVGIVIGIVQGPDRLVVGHGRVGPNDPSPPDGDTLFEIGSITKVFTAVLLADMVQRREVGLRDPVQRYLPDGVLMPTRGGKPITLYHLTTHSSGLPRMPTNFVPKNRANPYADYSVERLYAFLDDHDLERDPGAKVLYSNVGVGLLGHVLARAAGTEYATLVRQRITSPLGMHDTATELSPELRPRLAAGHDHNLEPVSSWDIPVLAGAGALRSTAADMLKFAAASLAPRKTPLSAALKLTRRPREKLDADGSRIGLGWMIRERHGRTIHWHNGRTGGYTAFIGLDQGRGRGVIVLSNATMSIDDIGFHLLDPAFELAELKAPVTTQHLPSSAAGVALSKWLEIVRSGDEAETRKHYAANFAETFKAAVPLDDYMEFRGRIRPDLQVAELKTVSIRDRQSLTAYLESPEGWTSIWIKVQPSPPHRIVGLLLKPQAPPD